MYTVTADKWIEKSSNVPKISNVEHKSSLTQNNEVKYLMDKHKGKKSTENSRKITANN